MLPDKLNHLTQYPNAVKVEACAEAMQKMRTRHIAIVKDIEKNYKNIEQNTQVWK